MYSYRYDVPTATYGRVTVLTRQETLTFPADEPPSIIQSRRSPHIAGNVCQNTKLESAALTFISDYNLFHHRVMN